MPPQKSNPKARSRRGCWTCKSRKVQCDYGLPDCRKCVRAGRECEGYGLRLSWPRKNDKKRSMAAVLPVAATPVHTGNMSCSPFINTTAEDIQLYHHLFSGALKTHSPSLHASKLWIQPQSAEIETDMELIRYFCDVAHQSLATFSPTMSHIRDVIISMVLSHDTASKRALLLALLAFSSLHRKGLHCQTMLLKMAALRALSDSAKEASQGFVEAAQHVAACMLLCSFEILLPSENSGEWLWYIQGAMEVVEGCHLGDQTYQGVTCQLLDWVYYHESMSRFTLYHWRHRHPTRQGTRTICLPFPPTSHRIGSRKFFPPRSPTQTVLNILSEICEVILDPSDPRSQEVEYRDRLRALEWKVDNLPHATSTSEEPDDAREDLELTIQLYQTATRVYISRASQNPLEPATNLDALIDEAFVGPVQNCYCRHFFPLLIIACEARTDEQRVAILNLIDRTDKKGYVRSMEIFRQQVESFWIQQDLHADSEVLFNYLGMLKAMISSNPALPSYV